MALLFKACFREKIDEMKEVSLKMNCISRTKRKKQFFQLLFHCVKGSLSSLFILSIIPLTSFTGHDDRVLVHPVLNIPGTPLDM